MTRKEKYPDTATFHYFNANPKNRITDDCYLRAICTALEEPYHSVLREMVEIQIETGYEVSCDKTIEKYLASKGWKKMPQPRHDNGTKFTGKEFCQYIAKKNGKYICNIGSHHIVAVIDKKVNDIWDSTNKTIGNYYIKEQE